MTSADKPLVSVVIRTKDRSEPLKKALQSVVGQTYPNIEVVLVNDGDSDVEAALESICQSLSAYQLISPPPPGGRIKAANAGLTAARGEFVIFLDDDDWFYPQHIEKLVEGLIAWPSYSLAYTGVECMAEDTKTGQLIKKLEYNQPFEYDAFLLRNFIPIHGALFRKNLLDDGTRMDESLEFYEDWDFWLQLLRKTDFLYLSGISACYFLGVSGGFIFETGSPRQIQAENVILKKWQHLWSTHELRQIVELGRQAPQSRQKLHHLNLDLEKAKEQVQQLSEESERVRKQSRENISALQQELHKARVNLQQESERLQQLKFQHMALGRQLDEMQRAHARVLASRSWRLTRPLRVVNRIIAYVIAKVVNLALRIRNAVKITLTQGPAAYWRYARSRIHNKTAAQVKPFTQQKTLGPVADQDVDAVCKQLQFSAHASPRVSVVIPVYNALGHSLACLTSMMINSPAQSFEVIVVDDASADRTQECLSRVENLVYIRNDENLGFVHSCNRGAKQARGEFLLFLNNDTEVMPDWLDSLVKVMDDKANAGIVGSKLVYPSGHLQEAGASLHQDGTVTLIGLNENPNDPRFNYLREVDHCSGASMMIKHSLFDELGGFDPCYAPAYFEDCDLSMKVREAGYSVYYQPASVVLHHLSVSTANHHDGKMAQIARNKHTYLQRWGEKLKEEDKVRLIAFYLPQFHPIPENDQWWGKGFTEWTNVTKAKPVFPGHYQPHCPSDLGYYDLRLAEARQQQADLARQYGVYGFCYYYYWFSGKRLLEKPLFDMLESGQPDFPFCICWANENWTRRWDGRDQEILIGQDYSEESNARFIEDALPILQDARYIRIHDKPLLLIYRADLIPGLESALAHWRKRAKQAGLGGLYLAAVESYGGVDESIVGLFDAVVEFPPHGHSIQAAAPQGVDRGFHGKFFDYAGTAENFLKRRRTESKVYRTVMPAWDNTARRQQGAHIQLGADPYTYYQWLRDAVEETRDFKMGDERVVFINAWNEWAEGNHLEPDSRFGHDYLISTARALDFKAERENATAIDPEPQSGGDH